MYFYDNNMLCNFFYIFNNDNPLGCNNNIFLKLILTINYVLIALKTIKKDKQMILVKNCPHIFLNLKSKLFVKTCLCRCQKEIIN